MLNEARGTAFWSQRHTSWEQVLPPRATQYHKNPGQTVDFHRFRGDEIIAAYCEQRDAIREDSDRPVTTNLMLPHYLRLNLWAFARELDVVASDQYPSELGLDSPAHVAFYADRSRSLAGGRPWLLMEQGTSTVYDGEQVLGKEPGEVMRHSLGHIARGSEGALFFRWRQSRAGAETWHSAMLPHAGPDSRIFREVTQTGEAPEQGAVWACPQPEDSLDEVAFTMASALLGRIHLSGRLPELGPEARALVHEAVTAYKAIRADLPGAVPSWSLGLPGWDDPWIALALHTHATTYLTALRLSEPEGRAARVEVLYPAARQAVAVWNADTADLTVTLPTAPSAALLRITRTEPDAL